MNNCLQNICIIAILVCLLQIECIKTTDVQLLDVKKNYPNTSVTIPLISALELPSALALCYNTHELPKFISLSLILCRHLGFTALQSIYPVSKHLLDSTHGMGLEMNVKCTGYEVLLDQCHFNSQYVTLCQQYLGIKCAGCNYTVRMEAYEKLPIEFPRYLPCMPNVFCQWKILMKKQKLKGIMLEFKSHGSDSLSYTYSSRRDFKGRSLEIQWYNEQRKEWLVQRVNENTLNNQKIMTIDSSEIILRYFADDCQFSPIRNTFGAIISSEALKQEISNENQVASLFYSILPPCVLVVGAIIVVSCLCCIRRKRKKRDEPNVRSSILSHKESKGPTCSKGDSCLSVAFRGFLKSSRQLMDEDEREQLHLDLGSAESSLESVYRSCLKLPQENNGNGRHLKRCTSFEVKNDLPFSQSPAVQIVTVHNPYEPGPSAEESLERNNESTTSELWGSPDLEGERAFSCKSSDSERSYFSVWQSSYTPGHSDTDIVASISSEHLPNT